MPRTPITIRVVPSRLARWVHALLSLALLALLIGHGSAWLAGLGLAWLLLVAWRLEQGHACGELRIVPEGKVGCRWHWRPEPGEERHDVALRCHYLGPWLIALEIDGRRLWLWPDSSSRESLRQLRHWLVQSV
ncbi:hypothetical protein [Halomonas sp. BC04]|uniref:hypothetical protein n=1 Tax=Halomonas sp. BC04 TaxID=1403540 RepID=UPI0018CC61A4|nr:hypothetical protein [Halomonas sp. BC04]